MLTFCAQPPRIRRVKRTRIISKIYSFSLMSLKYYSQYHSLATKLQKIFRRIPLLVSTENLKSVSNGNHPLHLHTYLPLSLTRNLIEFQSQSNPNLISLSHPPSTSTKPQPKNNLYSTPTTNTLYSNFILGTAKHRPSNL